MQPQTDFAALEPISIGLEHERGCGIVEIFPGMEAGPTHEILLTGSGLVAATCSLILMNKTNKSTT